MSERYLGNAQELKKILTIEQTQEYVVLVNKMLVEVQTLQNGELLKKVEIIKQYLKLILDFLETTVSSIEEADIIAPGLIVGIKHVAEAAFNKEFNLLKTKSSFLSKDVFLELLRNKMMILAANLEMNLIESAPGEEQIHVLVSMLGARHEARGMIYLTEIFEVELKKWQVKEEFLVN